MITTVIPYLLVATVPDGIWQHGLEYKYSIDISVNTLGHYNMKLYPGINVSNELRCQPKENDTLSCRFRHKEFDFFSVNMTSGEIIRISDNHGMGNPHEGHGGHHGHENHEGDHHGHQHAHHRRHAGHDHANLFNEIPFEVKFGSKNGVESIVMSENASNDIRRDIILSAANLLNIGTDSLTKNSGTVVVLTKSERMINFLTGKCTGEVQIVYEPDEYGMGNNELENFNLQLSEPLPPLTGNKLDVYKNIPMTNCPSAMKFFWSAIVLKHIEKDPSLKLLQLKDNMSISKDNYVRTFSLSMESNVDGEATQVTETMEMRLTGIVPANEKMSEIENPIAITTNSE